MHCLVYVRYKRNTPLLNDTVINNPLSLLAVVGLQPILGLFFVVPAVVVFVHVDIGVFIVVVAAVVKVGLIIAIGVVIVTYSQRGGYPVIFPEVTLIVLLSMSKRTFMRFC